MECASLRATDVWIDSRPQEATMPGSPTIPDLAATLMDRCDELATHTEIPGEITRRYGTPALAEVFAIVDRWMQEAGLEATATPSAASTASCRVLSPTAAPPHRRPSRFRP